MIQVLSLAKLTLDQFLKLALLETHLYSVVAPCYSALTTASSKSSSPEANLEMMGLLGSEGAYRSTPAYPTFKIVG